MKIQNLKFFRAIAGCMGKAITFIFALFCVITGIVNEVSAQPTTGTVRSRADFSPIRDIQVIMREVMCPVYGMTSTCSPGHALDTAMTGNGGAFTFDSTPARAGCLSLNDIDSSKNGSFQSRTVLSASVLKKNGSVLYMVPKDAAYQVKAKVISQEDNKPINGIMAVLCQPTVNCILPYDFCYTTNVPIDTAYSNSEGSIIFELKSEQSKAVIAVSDIDSSKNGGKFLAATSAAFSPIDDTAATIIQMKKDISSIAHPFYERESSASPSIGMTKGVVSIAFNDHQVASQSQILVLDARGATVTRLQPSADGIVKWYTNGSPRGIYFLKAENASNPFVARILLP
jgi:hypothetical protein